jgi:hypothetical protein
LPVTVRSWPVEVFSEIAPAVIEDAVWPLLAGVIVATPEATVALPTPLARSIALKTSPTVALAVVAPAPRYTIELPLPSVAMLPLTP